MILSKCKLKGFKFQAIRKIHYGKLNFLVLKGLMVISCKIFGSLDLVIQTNIKNFKRWWNITQKLNKEY